MDCPHCHHPLSAIEIETSDGHGHSIEECLNCGGHFIESYLANFLTLETTRNVDSIIPKSRAIPDTNPVCPKCGQPMSGIKDDSVPQTVTVFSCPNNHGDFFPKNQLYLFKQAQQSKIYFHKLWGIPLKSAFAVLIPILVIFSLATLLPSILEQATTTQETRIKASEILTPPLITPISSTQVLISFSTQKPAKTSVRFTEGLTKTLIVSTVPQTSHLLSIEDLSPGTLFKYIIIIDTDGKPVSTSEYTFSTP
ncbi:hypothetical protein A3K29_00650 [Candidatus Collierbacteria bacterium RIFOXYB2_FULL_46_14]|uniref:Transcription factor zinc-finger domain-containing protein n=1 Tax=Candidatus Collierbacteria bacterium GW2011_GWA2_46_26 TaxID=1618381 RepID=A0A0G1PK77_9BACT|nr:MAG: hypothetical protein UW29_C0008G0026 [Candidatus Collierbacteria bacterium GW2011_GWC2_44_13]KKU33224.1 MAG: hypothetical protein UX47_C0005G0026 [Candidatus Collierbacteria bacterium GW2011_GWA2_46_26]OGD72646.1 MAG: hypothetical protein A3K29_00650 [Candidatus Collierbacteria bacterium RIFOXYB2_FULL_46_14]OGD75688.1 MAG: hypothetical protein A3K43_00650 [Candidatus Collierbacteria bacterium RIFOXYA2_FULL_46_20]OGD77024.1 MAG: hypothetical protein A3K39_00650 [Candidatus Collierbacteri